jgi:HK97 gp10 family phage protein
MAAARMLKVTIKGLPGAQAKIRRLPGQINRGADRAVQQTAQRIMRTAKRLAPVDTGELRESIHLEGDPAVDGGMFVVASAEHAIYQEFGTYKMASQPFMTPAAEEGRKLLPEAARKQIARAVGGGAGGGAAGGAAGGGGQ